VRTIAITIDDTVIRAQPEANILGAALNAGVDIPHACFTAGAEPPGGSCKLCCVEMDGAIVYACSEPVAEGMVIRTRTPEVERLRRSRLQFPG